MLALPGSEPSVVALVAFATSITAAAKLSRDSATKHTLGACLLRKHGRCLLLLLPSSGVSRSRTPDTTIQTPAAANAMLGWPGTSCPDRRAQCGVTMGERDVCAHVNTRTCVCVCARTRLAWGDKPLCTGKHRQRAGGWSTTGRVRSELCTGQPKAPGRPALAAPTPGYQARSCCVPGRKGPAPTLPTRIPPALPAAVVRRTDAGQRCWLVGMSDLHEAKQLIEIRSLRCRGSPAPARGSRGSAAVLGWAQQSHSHPHPANRPPGRRVRLLQLCEWWWEILWY